MANATPIKITFHDDQDLLVGEPGNVHINAEKHASIVTGSSGGIDITATIEFSGLGEGEYASIFWRKVWKKTDAEDQNKGSDLHATAAPLLAGPNRSATVRFADKLSAADSGWTACLRLMYLTNSPTAQIVRRQFRGWKLEA